MTHEDAGRYARKHEKNAVMDPIIRAALLKRALHGTLSCAIAFDVAKLVGVQPDAVGRTADLMEESEWLSEVLCRERSGSPLASLVLARIQHHPQGCSEGLGMV